MEKLTLGQLSKKHLIAAISDDEKYVIIFDNNNELRLCVKAGLYYHSTKLTRSLSFEAINHLDLLQDNGKEFLEACVDAILVSKIDLYRENSLIKEKLFIFNEFFERLKSRFLSYIFAKDFIYKVEDRLKKLDE